MRVEVKVVQADGEIHFYEYASVDQAIVALGKKVHAPLVPPVKVRKGRADKGQPREPYGPRATTAAPEPSAAQVQETQRPEQAVPVAATTIGEPAASEPGQGAAISVAVSAPEAPATPTTTAPTVEAAQEAVKKVFDEKGMLTARAVLTRFNAPRAVNLLPEQRAEFIALSEKVLAIPLKHTDAGFAEALNKVLA